MFAEPQAIARGLRLELAHPLAGKVSLTRSPMRFSATALDHERPPPLLGEHTDEALLLTYHKRAGFMVFH